MVWLVVSPAVFAQVKVVALHPLMADLARQVGGDRVEVIALMKESDDPHHFNPTPTMLHKARGAKIYLASGMGLETYLDKLRDTLGGTARVIEVGKTLPARHIDGHRHDHNHDHDHGHSHASTLDPHWWHRVSNMQRAADVVAHVLGEVDAAHADTYKKNARLYRKKLNKLNSWIRREIIRIPRSDRKLATAHASFGYFCDEYGFQSVAVKGINKGSPPSAVELAEIIRTIKTQGIKAIFPERRSNPKALQTLSKETGVKIGGVLIADGADSYIKMMRHNVNTITAALAP